MTHEQVRGAEIFFSKFLHAKDWQEQVHIPLRSIVNGRPLETRGSRVPHQARLAREDECEPLVPLGRHPGLGLPPGHPEAALPDYYDCQRDNRVDVDTKTVERNGIRIPVVDGKGEYVCEIQS